MDRTRPTLTLDLKKYLGQLEDWDISQAEKEEWLRTLWTTLVSFAEIGFDIHPVQRVLSIRAPAIGHEKDDTSSRDVLNLEYSVQPHNIDEQRTEESARTQGEAP
ncbi:MAG: hypothetical protein AAF830_13985 [Pseudomonadota bacterium]